MSLNTALWQSCYLAQESWSQKLEEQKQKDNFLVFLVFTSTRYPTRIIFFINLLDGWQLLMQQQQPDVITAFCFFFLFLHLPLNMFSFFFTWKETRNNIWQKRVLCFLKGDSNKPGFVGLWVIGQRGLAQGNFG